MKIRKINKSDVRELLKKAAGKWQVYAPIKTNEGDTLFSLLPKQAEDLDKSLNALNLGDEWTIVSAKDILFPQQENMFHFDKDSIKEEVERSAKLIFGIKPCDLKGMLFSDEFFKRNFEDIYYLARAKDRLIVTIGCLKPPRPNSCFCASAKTGPFADDGYDIQLLDAGDHYLAEVGSEKGEEFVSSHSDLFKPADDSATDILKKEKSKAAKEVSLKVDFQKSIELMKDGKDFQENYKRIGERCIYCGGCVYTCPTCTCFNVFDVKKDDKGTRKRNWDACVFEGYTREASSHNPRDEKSLRAARRYEHKLKYDHMVTGMSGCVGCGRCLSSCPVEIGMSKFIEEITEDKRNM
ncbi:4Fe-4S dicluster domain-containing protein [Candidatus Omnitrophota bacterium]